MLGGSSVNESDSIAVDGSGNAYIAGDTTSTSFPTTTGAFQTSAANGFNTFVTKLNPTGTALIYSTYLSGKGLQFSNSIALDSSGNGNILQSFTANSTNFPTTTGAFQTNLGGTQNAFATKLNATGTALIYSTFLGAIGPDNGYSIAVDGSGNAYGHSTRPIPRASHHDRCLFRPDLAGGRKCLCGEVLFSPRSHPTRHQQSQLDQR